MSETTARTEETQTVKPYVKHLLAFYLHFHPEEAGRRMDWRRRDELINSFMGGLFEKIEKLEQENAQLRGKT